MATSSKVSKKATGSSSGPTLVSLTAVAITAGVGFTGSTGLHGHSIVATFGRPAAAAWLLTHRSAAAAVCPSAEVVPAAGVCFVQPSILAALSSPCSEEGGGDGDCLRVGWLVACVFLFPLAGIRVSAHTLHQNGKGGLGGQST